jgi:Protein of unknown function (DUF3160).
LLTGCQSGKNSQGSTKITGSITDNTKAESIELDNVKTENLRTDDMKIDNAKADNVKTENTNIDNMNSDALGSAAGENTSADTTVTKLLNLSKEWSLIENFELAQPEYKAPSFTAKVPSYQVAKDLSNIQNKGQFSGFSKNQIKLLSQNGFVVVPSDDTRPYYVYDDNEYKGIPNFITSDTALHLYHQFYDKSLMSIETKFLYQDLDLMTKQMLDKSLLLLKELKDEDLRKLQEKNVIYFIVARMLFKQSANLSVKADAKLVDTARKEYNLCKAAEGYQKSPLMEEDFDYSQFKVRGHYTRSKELGKYFKTMMWFGTARFAFTDVNGNIVKDNVLQSLLITFTTFCESKATCDAKLWSDIYQPTSQYVGTSDDINTFAMNSLRLAVYGNNDDPNIFNDEAYQDKLSEAVKALPEPRIKANLENTSIQTGKQFRFMGQRYLLDSDILQTLIDSKDRPIPTSLDVMGVLGSKTAQDLLFNVYKPQEAWPKYTDKYNKLKEQVSAYQTDYWKNNLYTGWLWSMKEVLTESPANSGMPLFMTNKAWNYKSLNTALASYTELKHDTVLYGKQATAEMGGPDAFAKQQYVEPDVLLYSKLIYLTDFTVSLLKEKKMLNGQLAVGADKYKSFLKLLMKCSMKELKNETLSSEEKRQLLWSGGTMESIINSFYMGVTNDSASKDVTDMLVTDISTCADQYLSVGTGYFDQIYVVVPYGGKLYLSRGSVYSFYEFVSNSRLTDKEWWALQGITVTSDDYGDYAQFDKPSSKLPKQPDWIRYFKTSEKNVKIKPLEADFDQLTE